MNVPPTHPLHPVMPKNACTSRITAAAGTGISRCSCVSNHNLKYKAKIYNNGVFISYAKWLGLAFANCPILFTAVHSCPGQFSVPVWWITLSRPLHVVGLVSFYLTNYLMCYKPIFPRLLKAFLSLTS